MTVFDGGERWRVASEIRERGEEHTAEAQRHRDARRGQARLKQREVVRPGFARSS